MLNQSQGTDDEQPSVWDIGLNALARVGKVFGVCCSVIVFFIVVYKACTWLRNKRRARKRSRSGSDSLEAVSLHSTASQPRRRKGHGMSSPSHAFTFEKVTQTSDEDHRQIHRPQPAPSSGQLHRDATSWSSSLELAAHSQPGLWESTQGGETALVDVNEHKSTNSPPGSGGTIRHQRPSSSASSSPSVSHASPWNRLTQSGRSRAEDLSANPQQAGIEAADGSGKPGPEEQVSPLMDDDEVLQLERLVKAWRFVNTSPPP